MNFLVNNEGDQFLSPAELFTSKGWNAMLETNLTGTFNLCKGIIYSPSACSSYEIVGETHFEKFYQYCPAKNFSVLEELSSVACFLLSPAASYITGHTVVVDAGQTSYSHLLDILDHDNWPDGQGDITKAKKIQAYFQAKHKH